MCGFDVKLDHLIGMLLTVVVLSLFCSPSWASDGHHHGVQAAHIHGEAELTVALEGESLEIGFSSPAMNLVGFEHAATTPVQIANVERAEATLKSAEGLFEIKGGKCKLKRSMVDVSAVLEKEEKEGEHHEHEHEHKHDHEHDEHEENDQTRHSEISASYQFECKQVVKLSGIATTLFERFPGIEKLQAMWVTDSLQGSALLTKRVAAFSLR
jgi:hypothetical protein